MATNWVTSTEEGVASWTTSSGEKGSTFVVSTSPVSANWTTSADEIAGTYAFVDKEVSGTQFITNFGWIPFWVYQTADWEALNRNWDEGAA